MPDIDAPWRALQFVGGHRHRRGAGVGGGAVGGRWDAWIPPAWRPGCATPAGWWMLPIPMRSRRPVPWPRPAGNWGCRSHRYERPSEIDAIAHPGLLPADSIEQACDLARPFGPRVLLTTGSKQLADYVRLLPDKTLIARVLPLAGILRQCEALGLGVNQIVAMTGPFSPELNLALYRHYRPDVMITKESGREGGLCRQSAALPGSEYSLRGYPPAGNALAGCDFHAG